MRRVKFGNGKRKQETVFFFKREWFIFHVLIEFLHSRASQQVCKQREEQMKYFCNSLKKVRLARQIFLQESFRRQCTPPQHQLSSGSPPWWPCPPPSSSSSPPTSSPPPSTSSPSRGFLSRGGFLSWIWKAWTLVISETTTTGNMC